MKRILEYIEEHKLINDNDEPVLICCDCGRKDKNLNKEKIEDKYILETIDGTVMANNVYVSTICEDMIDEKRNADDLIRQWKDKHAKLYNMIIQN